jgi:hypothetical protein
LAWGCGLDSTGSGQGTVAGCCECGDEPSGSCATEFVLYITITNPTKTTVKPTPEGHVAYINTCEAMILLEN